MIVVSHRGPYQFGRDDDGSLVAQRGRGRHRRARSSPLLADNPHATWIAAAMSDDDRDAERDRRHRRPRHRRSGSSISIREQHRMHYDVVANGVLWFLHHGMFDHARRPRFDLRFRDAWDAFVAVNQRFTDAVVERAAANDIVLVQDYQLALVPGQLRAQRPDLRVVHFTHTPFAGPRRLLACSRPTSAPTCARRWRRARRDSTPNAGPSRTGSRRAPRSVRAPRSPRRSPRASDPTSPRSRRRPHRPTRVRPRATSPTRSATGSS